MNHKLTYLAVLAMFAASCSSDDVGVDNIYTLSEDGSKTPIAIQTNLSVSPKTRAFDKTFESGDELLAYIEAGKLVDGAFDATASIFKWADNFSLTRDVTTSTEDGKGNITSTTEDSDLSPTLYWDDFSSTTYDLRESGRGIRLKYGYCYNGGTPSTALVEATGILGWTVLLDQSAADGSGMKHSDLLYAATQEMITYGHEPASRGTLTLPYTHAMSKVTINVTTGEGYDASNANFASSVLTLKKMQTKVTVDAPNDTIEASTGNDAINNVTTFIAKKENTKATYQAIVAPCTNLSVGNILASITNIDGNDYDIPITSGIIEQWKSGSHLWSDKETIDNGIAQAKPSTRAAIDGGTGYKTKPGVHYILDVTVEKQKITIRATLADWDEVKAYGNGEINFTGDVTEKGTIADALKAKGFDVYKSSTNDAFSTKSTTLTYAGSKWNYSPTIYWQNKDDNAYFRAISPAGNSASTLAQGTDLMWGTSGNTAITPRTGDVALNFDHLMSKLCINLETSNDAAAVNLTDATIKITKLANSGTFSIVDGSVSAGSAVETMLSGKPSGFTEYVVPQTIVNDARVIITLADGTTYSLQLNQCTTTDDSAVNIWTKGKSYTYTIHLEKENITFRALVKDWDNATGSGNATLEWD